MSTPPPENPLGQEHLERLHGFHRTRRILLSEREAEEHRRGEWTATPPGRLGRLLLADIEPYLDFFAIARAS